MDGSDKEKGVDQFENELSKARARIGNNSEEVMEWILRVAQEDPSELSAGDFMNLGHEMTYLAKYGVPQPGIFKPSSFMVVGDWSQHLSEREIHRPRSRVLMKPFDNLSNRPSTDTVKSLAGQLRFSIEQWVDIGQTQIDSTGHTTRRLFHNKNKDTVETFRTGNILTAFLETFYEVLAIHGTRLDRCQDCKRIFHAKRSDQRFCGKKCQSRWGSEQFRKGRKNQKKAKPPTK